MAFTAGRLLSAKHKANFEGVRWQQDCGLAAARCVLAVCGGTGGTAATHVTFANSTITSVRAGGDDIDAVLCVLGVGVRVTNTSLRAHSGCSLLTALNTSWLSHYILRLITFRSDYCCHSLQITDFDQLLIAQQSTTE